MASKNGATLSWTSFNLPSLINGSGVSSQFWYGPDRQRFRQVAIYTRRVNANPALEDTFYFTRDHQGNVDSITRADGSVQVRLSYDAFGRRRKEAGWSGSVPGTDWTAIAASSRRGYTEHEHLDNLGLIHMNGRVQDPLIGRFLSADPYVPDPWDGQSFNRYSYVRNNPLTRVDPTGFDDFCGRWCVNIDPIGGPNSGLAIAPNLYGTGALSYTASVLPAYMWEAGRSPGALTSDQAVDHLDQQTKQVKRAVDESVEATITVGAILRATVTDGRISVDSPLLRLLAGKLNGIVSDVGDRADQVQQTIVDLNRATSGIIDGPLTVAGTAAAALNNNNIGNTIFWGSMATPFRGFGSVRAGANVAAARGAVRAIDAPVEATRAGERFVRVGASPENLRMTFSGPGGTRAGTHAFPESTFNQLGRDPAALKNFGDLPGAPPQYFRIFEPPVGTPIQRGIVPGGEYGGVGGVPEVYFPRGF